VERRAVEPILPLKLFRNRVFSASSLIGFIVGFAMFGAITYLPTYLQIVRGASPTASGLDLLPLMGGLLVTSIGSGLLISRWGRYKIFPIMGTAVMTVGLYLLSRLDLTTSMLTISLFLVVLGLGLGSVMQVLVIAVQNAVPHSELRRYLLPLHRRVIRNCDLWRNLRQRAHRESGALSRRQALASWL
jgi:predicted MFS family arabinose efflux permease